MISHAQKTEVSEDKDATRKREGMRAGWASPGEEGATLS